MAPPSGKDLMMTIYGLDAHGVEVDAAVFAEKLKKIISALKKLDAFYNTSGHHKFMITNLIFESATVYLREKQIKSKRVRSSPAKRFAEIGAMVTAGDDVEVRNAADEFALSAFQSLAAGAGKTFSYGIVESPEVSATRLDALLGKRVEEIIRRAASIAEAAPPKYFKGTALETYDGVMKLVDLRGLFPEARLILSAGGKEISCIVPQEGIDSLRNALDRRALITGRAQHSGRSMIPERIDVTSIRIIDESANVLSLNGALKDMDDDPMREFG